MGTTEAAWPGWNHTFSTALPLFDIGEAFPSFPYLNFVTRLKDRFSYHTSKNAVVKKRCAVTTTSIG